MRATPAPASKKMQSKHTVTPAKLHADVAFLGIPGRCRCPAQKRVCWRARRPLAASPGRRLHLLCCLQAACPAAAGRQRPGMHLCSPGTASRVSESMRFASSGGEEQQFFYLRAAWCCCGSGSSSPPLACVHNQRVRACPQRCVCAQRGHAGAPHCSLPRSEQQHCSSAARTSGFCGVHTACSAAEG
jgi:hypothetical protein